MLCSNLQCGHSNRDTWKKIVQSQRFLKKKILNCFFFFFFAYGPCNNIHQFEGCFLRGQVSPNGFKAFKGCIVEYLSFIGLSAKKKGKKIENLLLWRGAKVVIGQSSSNCPSLSVRTSMYRSRFDGLFTYSNTGKRTQCLPTTSSCYPD